MNQLNHENIPSSSLTSNNSNQNIELPQNDNIPVQPLVNLDAIQAAGRGGVIGEAERIVDDFTWQRLLGFDGTFAFVEHVFWTISLNIVFDVVFRKYFNLETVYFWEIFVL